MLHTSALHPIVPRRQSSSLFYTARRWGHYHSSPHHHYCIIIRVPWVFSSKDEVDIRGAFKRNLGSKLGWPKIYFEFPFYDPTSSFPQASILKQINFDVTECSCQSIEWRNRSSLWAITFSVYDTPLSGNIWWKQLRHFQSTTSARILGQEQHQGPYFRPSPKTLSLTHYSLVFEKHYHWALWETRETFKPERWRGTIWSSKDKNKEKYKDNNKGIKSSNFSSSLVYFSIAVFIAVEQGRKCLVIVYWGVFLPPLGNGIKSAKTKILFNGIK